PHLRLGKSGARRVGSSGKNVALRPHRGEKAGAPMRCLRSLVPVLVAALAGCATSRGPRPTPERPVRPPAASPENGARTTAAHETNARASAENGDADAQALPAFEVREAAFTDFGMSVRTNLSVKWGEPVAWMRVGAVQPLSSAAAARLGAGDRILALDGHLVTGLGRAAMLAALFERHRGDRLQALVL